jgi:hypothetical protein
MVTARPSHFFWFRRMIRPPYVFYKMAAYHRSVLLRAKALAILTQRGHSLPVETELQEDDQ